MIAEFYAPTKEGERPVILHRDGHGERWIAIQAGTPVVYDDLAGLRPGLEPARIAGRVARIELLLTSPEPKLLVFLEPAPLDAAERRWGPSPMRTAGTDCWGEIDDRGDCRTCDYNGAERPHTRTRT